MSDDPREKHEQPEDEEVDAHLLNEPPLTEAHRNDDEDVEAHSPPVGLPPIGEPPLT